ncbi:MAG: DUF2318 domain-containing protein [Nitrospirae bacterium]|nr:DUF2318 domain-containing protein [Nitrospirota bacterium]
MASAGVPRLRPLRTVCLFAALFSLLIACTKQPGYQEPPLTGRDVAVDVKMLRPGVPLFFTYRYEGKKISFFVVRVDGRILSFLDACARCYPARLGYRFEDGYLVCRECSVKYAVGDMEKGVGSCFPLRVEGRLRDGHYLIPLSTLEENADKF